MNPPDSTPAAGEGRGPGAAIDPARYEGHTPGDWWAEDQGQGWIVWASTAGIGCVAAVHPGLAPRGAVGPNARLMADSPKLLAEVVALRSALVDLAVAVERQAEDSAIRAELGVGEWEAMLSRGAFDALVTAKRLLPPDALPDAYRLYDDQRTTAERLWETQQAYGQIKAEAAGLRERAERAEAEAVSAFARSVVASLEAKAHPMRVENRGGVVSFVSDGMVGALDWAVDLVRSAAGLPAATPNGDPSHE